jgi:PleD family two-component response regulator
MAEKRILIVDDSETVLMMERMVLRRNCYDVVTAKDGEEGIAKALELKPDLVLMDVIMPKMNGFEAVKELRKHKETRFVPILMVTTKAEAESMETGFECGCSDYVTKPINSLELLTKIRNFLGQ